MSELCKFKPVENYRPWRAMETAPRNATDVEVLLQRAPKEKTCVAHFAEDLSGEEQPPFSGWFTKVTDDRYEGVKPIGWRPL